MAPFQWPRAELHVIHDARPVKLRCLQSTEERRCDEVVALMDRARGAGVELLGWVPRRAEAR